ncbi:hypothetical protein AB1N83_003943 [Pleurotus pulmonarius]
MDVYDYLHTRICTGAKVGAALAQLVGKAWVKPVATKKRVDAWHSAVTDSESLEVVAVQGDEEAVCLTRHFQKDHVQRGETRKMPAIHMRAFDRLFGRRPLWESWEKECRSSPPARASFWLREDCTCGKA